MWKSNLEETKKHYIDWWNHKGIVLNMWEHFQNGVKPHADIQAPPPPKDLNQRWFDPEWRAAYLDWYVAHSSLMADMLPVANTQLGPGSLAAILGGVLEGGEDTIWIHPAPNFNDEIVFDESNPAWLLHKDLLRACKAKAKGNYFVGMPDLMEGLDIIAALKGTDKVLLDTVLQPDVLERQVRQINDIYFRVFDELYDIIREGDEMAFCYFSSWAPGKMSKLQCDISTMISTDDYRRFVQPFIREQCQKIDYTLYHLDGVGAMHHLPALLEIDELNAIQWTPGVGQPQGGSAKWYDLYKQILAGGKSIMASWVTLDELRPLLDNIGVDGVHLEMDFHNEEEVAKAMEIVDEYRSKSSDGNAENDTYRVLPVSDACKQLYEIAKQRLLVLDGATGTSMQAFHLDDQQYRGHRFADHPVNLRGCNDLLCLTRPDTVLTVHRGFLEAGADIITTDTFNAQRISLAAYRLEDYVREINLEAAHLARQAAAEYNRRTPNKPRFVAGGVGPTSKTLSMSSTPDQLGVMPFGKQQFAEAYAEQIEALIDGGVDLMLIETIFDVENARVALEETRRIMREKGRLVPVMLSCSIATPEGFNMMGQDIAEFFLSVMADDIFSVGLNCTPDIIGMAPFVARLAEEMPSLICYFPNAGLPDSNGVYGHTPEMVRNDIWQLAQHHILNIIGGCCGTGDSHIRSIAQIVEPLPGMVLAPRVPGQTAAKGVDYGQLPRAEQQSQPSAAEAAKQSEPPKREAKPQLSPAEKAKADDAVEPINHTPLVDAIIAGNSDKAVEATRKAIEEGKKPQEIINGEMISAMSEVGNRFQKGKAFVPQLLMAGRAMKSALALLQPLMAGDGSVSIGKVVIGTVKGDLHDIGKNLVASMLEGCGFEVVNVGIDVDADTFVDAVRQNEPDILCLSALLTTTMTYMPEVIKALESAGLRNKVKVMVGGAPVTQQYADEIGADGYSDNANEAVAVAKRLLGK